MVFRLLLLLSLFASQAASALEWGKLRQSSNIDDRRDETLYPEAPLQLITRYGQVAATGKMPFLCPSLKPIAAEASVLGQKLAKIKTPLALKAEFNEEAKDHDLNAGSVAKNATACEGSKQAATTVINANMEGLELFFKKTKDAHQATYDQAGRILAAISAKGAQPGIGDRINNAISQCPAYTQQYVDALKVYPTQVQTLLGYYKDLESVLTEKLAKINAIDCTSIAATPSTKKSSVPLPPARPKGL